MTWPPEQEWLYETHTVSQERVHRKAHLLCPHCQGDCRGLSFEMLDQRVCPLRECTIIIKWGGCATVHMWRSEGQRTVGSQLSPSNLMWIPEIKSRFPG